MASKRRQQSESGFYHVFQRGVCLFDIFEDDEDRTFYLKRLADYARELDVEIHAWCLMGNHTHLLIRAEHKNLSAVMRKIGSVYARYFNRRHERSGPLFEGRFGSVCVETDSQYLSTVRYIHRNPIHHDERTLAGDYPWSSYSEYVTENPRICRLDFAYSLFGGIQGFIAFHEAERDQDLYRERFLDIDTIGPMRDNEARHRANLALADAGFAVSISHIGILPHNRRDEAIAYVKQTIGCTLRQLQRLSAIAYGVIRNAIRIGMAQMQGLATSAKRLDRFRSTAV